MEKDAPAPDPRPGRFRELAIQGLVGKNGEIYHNAGQRRATYDRFWIA